MKKIFFVVFTTLLLSSCVKDDAPYYGYAVFENNMKITSRVIVDQAKGTASVALNTDQKTGVVTADEGSGWCSGTVADGVLSLNFDANETDQTREGFVTIQLGLHALRLTVVQRTTGVNHIEIINPEEGDPLRWTATCNAEQTSDGGGVKSIFTDVQTTFWHSSYSPSVPLPHWIVVDLKEERDINQIRLGWRMYGQNVYIHTKKVIIESSNDGVNFTPTGGEIYREPTGTALSSVNYPRYTDCEFNTVKARYIRLYMVESNASNGVCHVAYFKPYEP